jgi:hypothetical protein
LGATPPSYLSSAVVLGTPGYPNLNIQARYSEQIVNLGSFVNAARGQHVLLGHSLGSLISRGTYNDNPSASAHIAGIVAIAAPHQGTVLADSAITVRNFFGDVQRRINGAIPGVLIEAAVLSWLVSYSVDNVAAGVYLYVAVVGLVYKYGDALDLTNLYSLLKVPALRDLSPTSPAIDSLNRYFSDSQIQRANIYGSIPIQNAAIRVLYSTINRDADFPTGVALYNKAIALFKSCKYVGYATILGWQSGRNCGFAVKVLRRIDERWTRYVNGADAYGNARLIPFDGIVSNERSRYPSPNSISFDRLVPGVNHVNIYKTKLGLNQVRAAMLAIGMQPVAQPPPPPPAVAVSIAGPDVVNTDWYSTWSAEVTNGTAPYTYSWTGLFYGNSSTISGTTATGGDLILDVYDAVGGHASATKHVSSTGCSGQYLC